MAYMLMSRHTGFVFLSSALVRAFPLVVETNSGKKVVLVSAVMMYVERKGCATNDDLIV